MTTVRLTGQLICSTNDEAARVREHVALHVQLTRDEPGCLSFTVVQTENPLVWQVDEEFVDAAAFHTHQTRAAASEWARETAGIARSYTTEGL